MADRRRYPSATQVEAAAAQAKAVGISRIAALVDWSVANVQSIIRRYVSASAVTEAMLKRFRRA